MNRYGKRARMVAMAIREAMLGSSAFGMRGLDERITVVVITAEMSNGAAAVDKEPPLRASFFWDDGPVGHSTHRDVDALARDIADDYTPTHVKMMTQQQVDEFMSTAKFAEGSERVAWVQAENERNARKTK